MPSTSLSSKTLSLSFRSKNTTLLATTTAIILSSFLVLLRTTTTTFLPSSRSSPSFLSAFQSCTSNFYAEAKEIVATHEWQLLSENDTIPAGLHVKMDLSTGEKWAKLATDEARDEDIKAAAFHDGEGDGDGTDGESSRVEAVEMDASSGALSIVESTDAQDEGGAKNSNDNDNSNKASQKHASEIKRDYEMMHRVMSQLPPEELERFGGLPDLPAIESPDNYTNVPSSTPATYQLTDEQRKFFEQRMEQIWQTRQEELAKVQSDNVADLPSMLKGRIGMIQDYLEDVDGSLKSMLQERRRRRNDENENENGDDSKDDETSVNDIIDALRDLEFQLADVDMARDFHTLGGWPYLITLLGDVHKTTEDTEEEMLILVNDIQALAAMTIGTAVGNLGEFRAWAWEDVSSTLNKSLQHQTEAGQTTSSSALSLLIQSFERELTLRSQQMNGNTMAAPSSSNNDDAKYKSRATYKLRAVYALGSLLRGNPVAQQFFVSNGGADVLVRDVLGTLSNVRGPSVAKALTKLDYKFASKVLALGEDVLMDVVLHEDDYAQNDGANTASTAEGNNQVLTPNQLVAAFTTERWCDMSLRLLAPPSEVIGATASRGIKERALGAVRALAPGCKEMAAKENGNDEDGTPLSSSWGFEEVKQVRSEWNKEGSNDGLDSVYRRELLDLVDGVLEVLQ
ncbi:hypothetical protein ACHAXR_011810 [Thalassiosira sp. AJA248-18]